MSYAVVYQTKHGSARRYATWLAEDLGCEARDLTQTSDDQLLASDAIVLAGGNYYGSILGSKRLARLMQAHPEKRYAVVFVGATPMPREYGGVSGHERMFYHNFPREKFPHLVWTYCIGGYDPAVQSPLDRLVLGLYAEMLPLRARREPEKPFLAMRDDLRRGFDRADRAHLAPLAAYLKDGCPLPSEPLNLTPRG